MTSNRSAIFDTILSCYADTLIANAFRRALGVPGVLASGGIVAVPRRSVYADVDWARLMGQRHGVRM